MKKIVFIEDNEDIRETTQEILELSGYVVSLAEDGIKGVELVQKEKPDIIICDIMMPGLDGYGVLNILNRNAETASIPFIFLTAKTEKEDIRKGMNLGADDYIVKPFNETDLLSAIETRLERSEKLKKASGNSLEDLNSFFDEARAIKALKELSKERKIKQYRKKDVIFREDNLCKYLYFVVGGKIKCVKTDEYGKDFVNDIYGPGEFIGYTTLFDDGEYKETAIAMEETKVALIPKEEFTSLIQKNRDVATTFIKMLSGDIIERENRLLQLAYASIRERLAIELLNLDAKECMRDEDGKIKISREDLANLVGTAKESLIRTLSELKKDGLVETNGQEIAILDKKGLNTIASGYLER